MVDQVTKHTSLALSVARHIFKPLARFLLANGVTLPAIQEVVKQVLVEVAIADFPVKGKATTDSRISVLTGVHRKDVKRLRDVEFPEVITPKSVSLGSQIINVWMTEKKWRDKNHNPIALHKLPPRKGMKSFETLVESVSKDVRPRAVLDELVRSDVVEVKDDVVYLKTEAFIPKKGIEDSLYYLERGVSSHLNAAVTNVQSKQPPFFDRMVHYDAIPADAIGEISALTAREAMQFLKQVNLQARKQSKRKTTATEQLTVGIYVYHAAEKKTGEGGSE